MRERESWAAVAAAAGAYTTPVVVPWLVCMAEQPLIGMFPQTRPKCTGPKRDPTKIK